MPCFTADIPVVLFAYARPAHLARTLACLRGEGIPLLYVYSDGPRTPVQSEVVDTVRRLVRDIDWCPVEIVERDENLGLGRSIRSGVGEVLQQHEAAIVFEDDLICVPGTYRYLGTALQHYHDCPQVMSVAGWTHPRVNPQPDATQPYFDGRACCWVWGTWRRAWQGMERDALSLMRACVARGDDPARYGADLPAMAEVEASRNIWAVRWIFHHQLQRGLCVRPPWSLVDHLGFDEQATNARGADVWANPPLRACPPLPKEWPAPVEHPNCARLWQAACVPTVTPAVSRSWWRRIQRMCDLTFKGA
ncbi:MAG: hypothetical protein JNM56_34960 [Planctomycetia bacterium]|nr:hypothetical protein [Planctomycetia bacterium]